jgi:hypothetical protein
VKKVKSNETYRVRAPTTPLNCAGCFESKSASSVASTSANYLSGTMCQVQAPFGMEVSHRNRTGKQFLCFDDVMGVWIKGMVPSVPVEWPAILHKTQERENIHSESIFSRKPEADACDGG